MINIFINQDIVSTELKVRFAGEIGSDTSGVSRDAYTCFWREFLANNADGEDTRVPAVNTKWQKDEWMAIGRILLKGFVDYKYFPLMMSIPFVVGLIFGKDAVTTEILKEGFSKYLCVADRNLISKAEAHFDTLDDDDQEILADVLDGLGAHTIPTNSQEMTILLYKIAYKKLLHAGM